MSKGLVVEAYSRVVQIAEPHMLISKKYYGDKLVFAARRCVPQLVQAAVVVHGKY